MQCCNWLWDHGNVSRYYILHAVFGAAFECTPNTSQRTNKHTNALALLLYKIELLLCSALIIYTFDREPFKRYLRRIWESGGEIWPHKHTTTILCTIRSRVKGSGCVLLFNFYSKDRLNLFHHATRPHYVFDVLGPFVPRDMSHPQKPSFGWIRATEIWQRNMTNISSRTWK